MTGLRLNWNTEETGQRCFDALIEMMQTRDLDKCPTAEILERSGISRSTFYRHYQDKYDLLNKSYENLLKNTFLAVQDGFSYKKTFLHLYSVLREHQAFFNHAYRSDGQNSLKECVFTMMYDSMSELLGQHGFDVDVRYNSYLLTAYLSGTLAITYAWIFDGAQETPEEMLKLVYVMMPDEIRTIVSLYYM